MKHKRIIFGIYLTLFLIFLEYSLADLFNRAPDVLPGTLPEMRDPAYWIAKMKNPDEIIMLPEKIQRINETYRNWTHSPDPFRDIPGERKPTLTYWWPGIVMMVPDLHSLPQSAVADTVRKRITDEIDFLRSKSFGGYDAVKHSERTIEALEHEMALDLVKDKLTVRYGITVRTTRLRNVPSFFPTVMGMVDSGVSRIEQWNVSVLEIARPVTVLHTSRTGMYMFVLCEIGYGWIGSEDVAFGEKKSIDAFLDAADFVVCTGDYVPFYSDMNCTCASGWFRMGSRLPLVAKRSTREIRVPVRKTSGEFTSETAWLAENADVHAGWLPYIRRNIVVTAFKLLDTPYDWTGSWLGRQHERIFRDIFGCFGFDLPYHAGLFTFYGHDETVLHPEKGKDEQYEVILKHEPFVTIQSCGTHCQLLLGNDDGNPIVFQTHGYSYEDDDEKLLLVKRCCISDIRLPTYFLKNDITFLELK